MASLLFVSDLAYQWVLASNKQTKKSFSFRALWIGKCGCHYGTDLL